jgi:hypothetical protein
MTAQQPAVLDVLHRSDRFRSALVVVLIGRWPQPSGFTHNVPRTQGIVGGQYVNYSSSNLGQGHS